MKKVPLVISACLAGRCCRYDGSSAPLSCLNELDEVFELIVLCPEQLGGLPTPRPSAELVAGRVMTKEGSDVTDAFLKGASTALSLARVQGCSIALLMERSPSCGSTCVYDGTFSGTLVEGKGIFASLLGERGFTLYTPSTLDALMKASTVLCGSGPR
ncbi:MAG: DUF523 domain-containing protein [Sphaerochaeta sp.]|jgi:uncharacterized protein YbbK (DUF523 family)|uniref:DUF523 domain-containing protein n=2 Tax=Sphaerochaeta TaxID=399320 RepID=UPI002614C6F2|nr:DUF523 domain-containing protein [uncultured Sphaerochaeta sp.]MCK9600026.1 DUF523 domain-containing protein [Sphaerochaeta sp.]